MAAAGVGTLIGGRYRLKSPLAAGGMGTVWLAHHVELETDVAVKLVSRAHAKRPDLLERFRREARSAAQLKTPHVVQILDFGVDEGVPYIAMELLEGEDLEALLDRELALSPARALAIVRPLCKALSVAHAAGIVHRDLKPANVFLARIAGEEVVKIVDFGIAKELGRGAEWATGALVLGSPLFMSPEQVAGSAELDARTDIWSLTVLTYLLILGEPPFVADGVHEVLQTVSRGKFAPPSTRAAGLAPLDAFFTRGLARSPQDRFPDVAALAEAFEAAVSQLADPHLAVEVQALAHASVGTVLSQPPTSMIPEPDTRALAPLAAPEAAARTQLAEGSGSTSSSFARSTGPSAGPMTPLVPPPPRRVTRSEAPGTARWAIPAALLGSAAVIAVAYVVTSPGDLPVGPAPAASIDAESPKPMPSSAPASMATLRVVPSAAAVPASTPSAAPSAAAAGSARVAAGQTQGSPPGSPGAAAQGSAGRSGKGSATGAPPAAAPASSPAKPPAGAPAAKPATIDPEWGVPVQSR